MLQKIKGVRLRNQVVLIIAFEILLTLTIQSLLYMSINNLANNSAMVNASNAANQVEGTLTTNINEIKNVAKQLGYNNYIQAYLVSDDPIERLKLQDAVKSAMSLAKSNNINIYQIYILDKKNREFRVEYNALFDIERNLVDKQAILNENFHKEVFSSQIYTPSPGRSYYSYTMPIFSALPGINPLQCLGACAIICKTDSVQQLMQKTALPKGSLFYIQDTVGNIVASNCSTNIKQVESVGEATFSLKAGAVNLDGARYLLQRSTIPETGWKTTCLIPEEELIDQFSGVLKVWIIMGIAVVFLLLVMGALMIYSITTPISQISNFTATVVKGSKKERLVLKGSNEIGRLSENINTMLDSIDSANKTLLVAQSKMYEMELGRKQAELSALKSQINPHFLYNTLDCMRSIALTHEITEIAEISEAMSKIFRYSIKGSDLSPVRDEMDCINSYIRIIDIRYPNRFQYDIDIDEQIMDIKFPKMILQPLVENAIYHGMEPKRGKCCLTVIGKPLGGDSLYFEVTDDGIGMSPDELAALIAGLQEPLLHIEKQNAESNRYIGLKNIYSRIRMLYGENCSIDIHSKKDEGTQVIIQLGIRN